MSRTSHDIGALDALAHELMHCAPGGVSRDVPLGPISRWKIGGPAAIYVEPASAAEAAAVMKVVARHQVPLFVMGDASNTLFDSSGFDGVVLRIGRRMSRMRIENCMAWAEAGAWMPRFSSAVGRRGLSGIEHTVGIPGTLGGLILMNGGSQRKGIGLNVVRVLCANERGELFELDQEQCGFGYRKSALQSMRAVILEATLQLEKRAVHEVRREMLQIMRSRRTKFPQKLPNCGSTFLSDPKMYETVGPPGLAIERAGLKGLRRGGAEISPMHANFIVNVGGATSDDVLWLISRARTAVLQSTGYAMDCEVRHLSPKGLLRPAHVAAEEKWGADVRAGEP